MPQTDTTLQIAAQRLSEARTLTVLTGAGVSAESGVPTFRDALTGLWAQYDPAQLATPEAFAANPQLVWQWYQWRRELVANARPNAAHFALARLERHVETLTLVTQNVDGLHQLAGSRAVVELHGNLAENRCSGEHAIRTVDPADTRTPPHCPQCDALLRPNVVWFGEALPAAPLERAVEAACRCDLMLCIGTSGLVYPAAALPTEALAAGVPVVEINVETTPLTAQATYPLRGKAGTLLPRLLAEAFPQNASTGSPA